MPWNQPGSGGGKDPWGQNRGQQGPPDLDEIVKNLQQKFYGLFGGKSGGGGGKLSGSGKSTWPAIAILLIIVAGVWIVTGFYTVQQGQQAVVLQFGKYKTTVEPGLHWIAQPIQEQITVDVSAENTVAIGFRQSASGRDADKPEEALMLTKDQNIVDVKFTVLYDIKDAAMMLFNAQIFRTGDYVPEVSQIVRSATESAIREVVGGSTMDEVITTGRVRIAADVSVILQRVLDRYGTGVNVKEVKLQNGQPPHQVQSAFDDAIKAKEDKVQRVNKAEAFANEILPRARGQASRIVQTAEGHRESVIAKANGETSRFLQVLAEYQKAPDVTRDRLYLEAMESVFSRSDKLMIDQKGGNNIFYLPLDQLIRKRSTESGSQVTPLNQSSLDSTTGSGNDFNVSSRNNSRSTLRGRSPRS